MTLYRASGYVSRAIVATLYSTVVDQPYKLEHHSPLGFKAQSRVKQGLERDSAAIECVAPCRTQPERLRGTKRYRSHCMIVNTLCYVMHATRLTDTEC